ncbi:MOSC domain-containing protein [Yoonia sp. R2331]|uniref:MOSC domain-containing protein n=1 Tax=Yoonia sp. R2331 TaxID=3237238 RepID=UPI0034E50D99
MTSVANLWRHPIKSHGREALTHVTLVAGQAMPWDRHWAVTHDLTKHDGSDWSSCRNFMIGVRTPQLAGIWAELDEDSRAIKLHHADLGEIVFRPDDPAGAVQFLNWVEPLTRASSVKPKAVVTSGSRGMTDSPYPSISIMNHASHAAVAAAAGGDLEVERWRGNIWLEGLAPWEEHDWIGREVQIGGARLAVRERIGRCLHTAANPVSGQRDVDTLGVLSGTFGHQDFGIYAEVVEGGPIACGDPVKVL